MRRVTKTSVSNWNFRTMDSGFVIRNLFGSSRGKTTTPSRIIIVLTFECSPYRIKCHRSTIIRDHIHRSILHDSQYHINLFVPLSRRFFDTVVLKTNAGRVNRNYQHV